MDLGLGVYEETEVDGDFNEVGLEPLITSTTSVVVEEAPHEAGDDGVADQPPSTRHPRGADPGAAGWSPGPPQGYGTPPPPGAPAPYAAPYATTTGTVGANATADIEQVGKLFLGGISWQTDENQLHAYFSSFGELIDVAVMRNKVTGISRGFGFITYSSADSVETVLAREHHLDGRRIDIKRAVPRDRAPPALDRGGQRGGMSAYGPAGGGQQQQQQPQPQQPGHLHYQAHDPGPPYHRGGAGAAGHGGGMYGNGAGAATRKLFVGGIPPTVTEAEFRQYFERFGAVVDAVVMYDRNTLRSRGFGFVTFADLESARAVLSQQHELQGKFVEVKSAEPKEVMNAQHAAVAAQHHHHPHADYQNYQQPPPQQQYVGDHHPMQQHHHAYGAQGGSAYGMDSNMHQRPDAVYHDARGGMQMPPQQHHHPAYAPLPGGPSHYQPHPHDPYHHGYAQHYGQQQQQPQVDPIDQQQHYASQQQRGYDASGRGAQGAAMGDAYAAYQQQRNMAGGPQQQYGYPPPPPPPQDNFAGSYRGQGGSSRNRDRGYRGYNG
ncbi:hypothetical protein CTAYLR_005465 [Chrysophaeum taylorii]|uniref:RRM domain-containing protein n=1 Tax=Chrysophaeum taylorii TaxID=2483200 RepID=A0AAD7XLJ7_9STRA|nr:hypothetical protein CTAYLR_005465 [Chrysophaeum taylorii]